MDVSRFPRTEGRGVIQLINLFLVVLADGFRQLALLDHAPDALGLSSATHAALRGPVSLLRVPDARF